MRRKHRRYLPQEPRELDDAYDNRLSRSVCSPYLQRLERMLAGMLTRKPVRLNDVTDTIREQLFDVDLQGHDLNTWTYETARKMIRYGHVGVLVDAPADGGRPYWVTYTPRDILGFRHETVDGISKLSQLRLRETIIKPDEDSEFGEEEIEQIRVLKPGEYQIYQRTERKGDWAIVDEGTTSLQEIPFSVAYSNRVSVMESRPPMEDIANSISRRIKSSPTLTTSCTSAQSQCWRFMASQPPLKKLLLVLVKRLRFPLKDGQNISSRII